jgi:ankyrin repeat protein
VSDLRGIKWILSILRTEFKFTPSQIEDYINAPGLNAESALHEAIQATGIDCVRTLIENRANLDFGNPITGPMDTPLARACMKGYLDIVKLLLRSGAKRSPAAEILGLVNHSNNEDLVKYLGQTRGYTSRLHYAEELPEELVLELLRAGADIHYRESPDGISPFQVAERIIESREKKRRRIPMQLQYVWDAGKPWSPDNHITFPEPGRKIAIFLFMYMAHHHSEIPIGVWMMYILPFVIDRGRPLSREEANWVCPGDGRLIRDW